MKKSLIALSLCLPIIASAEAIDMQTCRATQHRGIGVGANNYQGEGCLVPVQIVTRESERTTIIIDRIPAQEEVIEAGGPSVDQPADYGE